MKPLFMQAKTCLILSMRHLGDAVINAGLINALKRHNPDIKVDVLGRPELRDITTSLCSVDEYLEFDLPIFGHHRRGFVDCINAFFKLQTLRKRKYDVCLNLMGDTRENLIGKLTGAVRNISPLWEKQHPFRRHIRSTGARLPLDWYIDIPSRYRNFYQSINYFLDQFGIEGLTWPQRRSHRNPTSGELKIALHPGASQVSKRWPVEKWQLLIFCLCTRGYKIKLMGSPSERAILLRSFQNEITRFSIEIVTRNKMVDLLESLRDSDILIGMDSFSTHVAYALNLPVVMLHGPFDPSVMTPPGSMALSSGHLCKSFPCFNKPTCQSTDNQFVCVRGIEVDLVLKTIEALISSKKAIQSENN